jgi:hypothetical protein
VSFRPTCLQALGRGSYLGGLVGLVACFASAVLVLTGVTGGGLPAHLVPFLPLVPLLAGVLVGSLLGPVFCRHEGADIDDLGIRSVPRRHGGDTAWQCIEDLRAERRGGRTRVAVYVDNGQIGWLRAPYSGRLLATDREFERKLFMLRNVLATHRSFALTQLRTPDPAANS